MTGGGVPRDPKKGGCGSPSRGGRGLNVNRIPSVCVCVRVCECMRTERVCESLPLRLLQALAAATALRPPAASLATGARLGGVGPGGSAWPPGVSRASAICPVRICVCGCLGLGWRGGCVSVRAAAEGGREGGRGLSVCLDPEPPAWVSRAPQVPPSEPPPNPDAWCVPGLCASCLRPAGRLAARVLLSV